jgi:lipopolysaccharide export system protein LptA
MPSKRLVFSLALAAAVALAATAAGPRIAGGQAAPPEKPAPLADTPSSKPSEDVLDVLDVSADQLDVDVQAKTAVLSGNVKLSKAGAGMTVSCPRVDARYDDAPRIIWAKGSGGVVAVIKGVRAEAPEIEIDIPAQTLSLKGGVRIARGAGFIKAERATIHMATGKVSMSDVKGSIPVGAPPP